MELVNMDNENNDWKTLTNVKSRFSCLSVEKRDYISYSQNAKGKKGKEEENHKKRIKREKTEKTMKSKARRNQKRGKHHYYS